MTEDLSWTLQRNWRVHSFYSFSSSIIQNRWYELTKKHYDMLIVFTFKNKLIFNADTCIKLCDIHARNIQYYSRYLRYIKKFMFE